jgi:hypothetical protein
MEPNRLASATGITARNEKRPDSGSSHGALPFTAHIPAYVRVSADGIAPACHVATLLA